MKSIYQSSGLKRTAVFLIFTAVIAMTSFSPIMAQDDQIAPEGCLVQISATHQTIDPLAPWQSQPTGTRYGYGVLIDEKHVLTTESLVRNCKRLELLSHRSGKIFSASLIIADCQTDLALLELDEVPGDVTLNPVELSDDISKNDTVNLLQFDSNRSLQTGTARVQNISMTMLPNAPYSMLSYELSTDLNVDGHGIAVLSKGKLAGIVISYNNSARSCTILPASVLKRFIEDASEPPYKGFASAGFIWTPLIDPIKRDYLNVGDNNGGILVLSRIGNTGAEKTLEPNDVILEWEGHSLDSMGFYDDEKLGRISVSHLIRTRTPGDTVQVKLVRDKKPISANLQLTRLNDENMLIPENIEGDIPEYLITGGFVLRELTGDYLRSYGDWDPRLSYIYHNSRFNPEKEGQRIVLLSYVIPDTINIGYQNFRDGIVDKVNGKPINNMNDVFKILDQDGQIWRLSIRSIGTDLVLDRKTLQQANRRLAFTYQIPAMFYRKPEQ